MFLANWVLVALGFAGLVVAQEEGSVNGPTTSPEAAGYSCDASQCKLPKCNCASPNPPGGLKPSDVPQFIVFTADDAIQSYTIDSVNQFLAHRKNPNGCTPKMSYYTSLSYTNYSLITDWYVAGNEIADHTMTHAGDPSEDEINGNLIAINALSGIPLSSIKGFRAPFLNYTAKTLKALYKVGFEYDSSASASIPVTDPNTDAYWPYTLDYGMANDCLSVEGTCKGQLKLPGFWEIPMYAFFDKRGGAGPHLMDPWLDTANGNSAVNDEDTLAYMKDTFTAHYNGNRQPIGLYTHPIHLAPNYPGVSNPTKTVSMVNAFLDWAQQQQNVWIISSAQLLAWTKNPIPLSQLDSFDALKCTQPAVDAKICNGMPKNEEGLIGLCAFSDAPFYTCYGCPVTAPTVANPNPAQQVKDGEQARFRLPATCSTAFWDPIKGECLCQNDQCKFTDESRPIGPNGANLTGGGLGGDFGKDDQDPTKKYVPFNGGLGRGRGQEAAVWLSLIGVFMGSALATVM